MPRSRTIFLVRHGETDWNKEQRYQGQTDVPLNQVGRDQALELRARLARRPELFDPKRTLVVTSDLQRAAETARLTFAVPGREIGVEPDLRECGYGIFEGLSRAEIQKRHPQAFAEWQRDLHGYAIEGGEDRKSVRLRAEAAVHRWLERATQEHVVFVTHGGVMRQLVGKTFRSAHDMPTQINFNNLAVHLIAIDEEGWSYAGNL